MPRFDTVFQADLRSALDIRLLPLLLAIVMVDFFDTIGTVTAIAETGDLHDREGRIPRLRSILAVDSISAMIGGAFGVSSVTSYIESAAGVAEGRADRPAQRRRRGPVCRVHVRGAAGRHRARRRDRAGADRRRVPDVPADHPDRLQPPWTPRSPRS